MADALGPPGFFGRRITALALLGHWLAIGTTMSIFGVFIKVAADDFDIGMGRMGIGHTLLQLAMGLGGPLIGWVLARYSARWVMLAGALSLSTGLVLLSRVTEPWQAGVLLATLVGIGSLMAGPLPSATLVANWFVAQRGRALGVAASGTTGASLTLPPLAGWLIVQYGWRDALAMIAIGATVLVIPFILAWAVNRPEQRGQAPDGAPMAPEADRNDRITPPREILRDRNFWLLSIIFGALFAAGLVMLLFTVPYAMQLGMSLQGGAWLLAARSAIGIVGKVTLGSLCDRFDMRWVLAGNILFEGLFWLVILYAPNVTVFVLGGLGLSFFSGALLPVKGAVLGGVFGRPGFSQAMGLMNTSRMPFQFLAAPIAGFIYDSTGDYGTALRSFLIVFIVALALVPFLRIPEVEPGLEPLPARS